MNNPEYYKKGNIEVIDFIIDQNFNFVEGNIIKYICRYKYKGTPLQDLEKANKYSGILLEIERRKAKCPEKEY